MVPATENPDLANQRDEGVILLFGVVPRFTVPPTKLSHVRPESDVQFRCSKATNHHPMKVLSTLTINIEQHVE